MSVILGLNAYHADSAACVIVDGRLVAAAEEERFLRIKHWAGFPAQAIAYCLREARVGLPDVDQIAVNSDPRAHLWRKVAFAARNRPDPALVLDRVRNARERVTLHEDLARAFPEATCKAEVRRIEHHLAHLASCFYVSPFDDAVVLSVDGFGDFASAAWGAGHGHALAVDGRVYFPHSLGIFYQAMTQYLGFPHYGDEYKIMGLAPYGEPRFRRELRQLVRLEPDGGFSLALEYFRHARERVPYTWSGGSPEVGALYSEQLVELLGPVREPHAELEQRHRDIARSTQAVYEEAFFHLLNHAYKRYAMPRLALAGGCGMNSVANGKIALASPFRQVYVQAAAGDAGGAIGAAFVAAQQVEGRVPKGQMAHAHWGPAFSNAEIAALLSSERAALEVAGCRVQRIEHEAALCRDVARRIADGNVVGWFHGRMEWGPRALGNRSILGDPRRADMKAILNAKIKRRESFRPFAPSVLREAVDEWFEQDADVPFMTQVFQVREDKRSRIPAVTHVDGSGRLQTVSEVSNARYYHLITAFREQTGIPLVLNTSFNENEPVVCRPAEALDCFLRTRMDVLVLEDFMIERAAGLTAKA